MPPFTYENNRTLAITFKTSPDVLRALVPEPLVVNADSLVTIYVGALNVVDPKQISYYEAGIMIPVSFGRDKGCFMPVLYLDNVLPITIGWEVFGYPKFQAQLSMEVEANVVHASVMSGGAIADRCHFAYGSANSAYGLVSAFGFLDENGSLCYGRLDV
jgi:acetoacetate decarboxylase